MLVLSRKPLQSIMIGPDIKVTVVKVERNQVRIGIEAPRDVTILRDELLNTFEDGHGSAKQPLEQVEMVTT